MFLIHKVANRRPSRDQMVGRTIETAATDPKSPTMDYNYCYDPMPDYQPKKVEKRRSRSKSGFFSGRASLEDEVVGPCSESRGSIVDKDTLMSFGKKKKLRKAASFQPVTEEESAVALPKSPLLRRVPESWKGRSRTSSSASATSSAREGKISQPFNFFHISHANQRDFPEIKQGEIARDWVRISSSPLEKKATSPQLTAPKKHSSYGLRSKFLSRHQSPTAEFEPTPCPSEESFTTCTSTPVSPLPLSPATEDTAPSPVEYVCHAITTPDLSAYGRKCVGIERMSKDQTEKEAQSATVTKVTERSCTPDAPIPEVRETLATPEQDEPPASQRLTKRISINIRPMSQFSDFNADFIVPGSPLLVPSSRLSKRYSAQVQKYHLGVGFDDFTLDESWEEDIDYSYEHAAESHCDFEWERSSNYAGSTYGDDNETLDSPETSQCLYLKVPEKQKEYAERRITGQFEAHLLLPGSAGSDTVSIITPDSNQDIACETVNFDNGIILRAARSSLSNRSIESMRSVRSSTSVNKMLSRNYRDVELARVAEHLEDHIAFLNAELCMNSPRESLRPPSQLSLPVSTGRKTLTRARTDSDATCVTLCSDAETITPIESSEVITPPNSNHNSFTLHKQYDEERMAKGLSFPASTIPGVIEFSPEIHDLPVPEDEFIPFI
ncbi:hypothetical protein EV426DRAFT_15398 [Tirmania nivea]|nr:hypothetical protein EV426DRAFT_15398 [Tirmania nivea]